MVTKKASTCSIRHQVDDDKDDDDDDDDDGHEE